MTCIIGYKLLYLDLFVFPILLPPLDKELVEDPELDGADLQPELEQLEGAVLHA